MHHCCYGDTMKEAAVQMDQPALAKRMFDLALALPGLVVAAPIVLVAMALIRATSQGPLLQVADDVCEHTACSYT